jgi:outer membrane receptor for monomeric catechols
MRRIKNYHAGLIYHLFAHMNLMNNASNLYDREYIERIKCLKFRMNKKHYLEEDLYVLTDKGKAY